MDINPLHLFRESISAVCIAAAWCDGEVNEFEKQALDRIHAQIGFTRSEIMERIGEALQNGPSGETIDIPTNPEVQKDYMRLVIGVCLADGYLDAHEVNFLAKLAQFLAVPPDVLEQLKAQAESLLRPTNAVEVTPEHRVATLLAEQVIKLEPTSEVSPTDNNKPRRDSFTRKPLSELLFQGEDYGSEISFG